MDRVKLNDVVSDWVADGVDDGVGDSECDDEGENVTLRVASLEGLALLETLRAAEVDVDDE